MLPTCSNDRVACMLVPVIQSYQVVFRRLTKGASITMWIRLCLYRGLNVGPLNWCPSQFLTTFIILHAILFSIPVVLVIFFYVCSLIQKWYGCTSLLYLIISTYHNYNGVLLRRFYINICKDKFIHLNSCLLNSS